MEKKFVSKVEVFVQQEVKVVQKTLEEKVKELEGNLLIFLIIFNIYYIFILF